MLQKQPFFLSLAQGIDTKDDEKQVVPGKLLILENGVFTSPKEIRKRNGYQPLSLSIENNFTLPDFNIIPISMRSGNFLASFNKEIVLNDNFDLYSFSESLDTWIYKGNNTICELSTIPIVRNTNSQSIADSAINPSGIQVFAWEDSSGNVKLSTLDTLTDQIIIANKEILPSGGGNTLKPKCVEINNRLIIFYLDNSTAMHLKYITYINGIFSSPVDFATDVNVTNNNYDLVVANNKLYITYNTDAASIKTFYLTPVLTPSAVFETTGQMADNCITVFVDLLTNVWIAWGDTSSVNMTVLNEVLEIQLTPPTVISSTSPIYNITGTGDSGFSTIFYDVLGSTDVDGKHSNSVVYFSVVLQDGTNSSSEQQFLRSSSLQSKAFSILVNSTHVPHVTLTHDANLQPTYFLCNLYNADYAAELENATIISKIAPSLGGGIPTKKSSLSAINLLSTNVFQTALLQKDLLFTSVSNTGTVNTYSQTGVISSIFDFTVTNLNTQVLGDNLHIGSGLISMYDGANIVEHNFNLYPEAISIVVNTSGGNLTDSSSYGYQVTYEWTDNQGQLHRSAPSPVISIMTGSHSNASQAVLTIPTLRITAKKDAIIVIYRTQANGTVYYRLNSPIAPLYNNTTTDTVTYTDNASDASIAANEQLYTTGGEVNNSAPPASSIIGEFKNRIILIPSEDPTSFWYSKQVIPGSPVEFSDVFVQNIGTDDGPITAFIQMDSNGIFFKEHSIFYISGDGPSPSGENNDFSQALSIAADVGCISSESLILMPMGIIFKSHKGIYLLSRGLSVQYIGSDVEKYNDNTITSAQLISHTNQIRFTLDNSIVLVYDYFVSQWSVFTNINTISSIITNNTFTYVQPDGLVLQESPGIFNDNGAFIKLRVVTSWLSLAGIQGFQRIYKALILGQYFGPHKLLVQFAYDFNPINIQQTYIDATRELSNGPFGSDPVFGINSPFGGEYPLYQWRIFNSNQTCQSIQITIEDIPVSGPYITKQGSMSTATYNESLSLSAISLELGMKKGLNKLAKSKSFG